MKFFYKLNNSLEQFLFVQLETCYAVNVICRPSFNATLILQGRLNTLETWNGAFLVQLPLHSSKFFPQCIAGLSQKIAYSPIKPTCSFLVALVLLCCLGIQMGPIPCSKSFCNLAKCHLSWTHKTRTYGGHGFS